MSKIQIGMFMVTHLHEYLNGLPGFEKNWAKYMCSVVLAEPMQSFFKYCGLNDQLWIEKKKMEVHHV